MLRDLFLGFLIIAALISAGLYWLIWRAVDTADKREAEEAREQTDWPGRGL